jgi:cyanophycin synthetase
LTGGQDRLLARWNARLAEARATPPTWIRDSDRRIPIASISGTNGKSTVTRLITHILLRGGRHVGTTTSDGVLVNERMVDPGDWTGPGGAQQILARHDIDVAVLETARGGIVLRGVGYESNETSVLTNISSDHLDQQGIHTLPELAEVKSTICRLTRPDGWVVLNADDPLVAAVARRVRGRVALFSLTGIRSPAIRQHLARGGRAYFVRDGVIVEAEGPAEAEIVEVVRVPITIGGLARHNVANALAAAGGARGMGATLSDVREGLLDFAPDPLRSPGRLNLYRLGAKIVIVDFAHNEAGIAAVLDVAEGIAAGAAGRATPITAIIGTAGDRPDDALRGIGRIAASRAQRVAIKETRRYLRGRTAESVVGELLAGVTAGGIPASEVPVYPDETQALQAELNGAAGAGAHGGRSDAPRVIVLMCHQERDEVHELLARLGARPVDVASELGELVPRLQERSRRG